MAVEVDPLMMDATLHGSLYLTYQGHYISRHFYPKPTQCHLVKAECVVCGKKETINGEMSNAEAWTAFFYLMSAFEHRCPIDYSEAAETIENEILPSYAGELATSNTFQRIEQHIQNRFNGMNVDIRT